MSKVQSAPLFLISSFPFLKNHFMRTSTLKIRAISRSRRLPLSSGFFPAKTASYNFPKTNCRRFCPKSKAARRNRNGRALKFYHFNFLKKMVVVNTFENPSLHRIAEVIRSFESNDFRCQGLANAEMRCPPRYRFAQIYQAARSSGNCFFI